LAPKADPHLKNVPDYLVPDTLKSLQEKGAGPSRTANKAKFGKTDAFKRFKRKQNDPLKSFQFSAGKKRKL
jgi:ATP-dependent RNA helicase DDX56/DBP9